MISKRIALLVGELCLCAASCTDGGGDDDTGADSDTDTDTDSDSDGDSDGLVPPAGGWDVTFTPVEAGGHAWLWRSTYGQTNQDLWNWFAANAIP